MEQQVRKAETPKGPKKWKCKECSSNFQRLDHMKRHALTRMFRMVLGRNIVMTSIDHTVKSHLCLFCGSSFSRGDVLRRHWKSCKARVESGHTIPQPERGGKHKRACDSCAGLRKACNEKMPCAECTQREKQCTYRRLLDDELHLPSTSQALPEIPDAESLGANDDGSKVSESSWDLGPATLYPPHMKINARRQKLALG
ncbi:unnamed protein product [Penicillium egyptiacum]|uniref:Zn(2)-C6 fungal-type domain-containing protein n=1 Tax=Penicillium egyptiacum TaxID=1303716 RepID=A0A9W4KLH9_9EURO|nr:unnamed protein product [Penicillium egyptiacum]